MGGRTLGIPKRALMVPVSLNLHTGTLNGTYTKPIYTKLLLSFDAKLIEAYRCVVF